jgi:hypothetical protein
MQHKLKAQILTRYYSDPILRHLEIYSSLQNIPRIFCVHVKKLQAAGGIFRQATTSWTIDAQNYESLIRVLVRSMFRQSLGSFPICHSVQDH